MTRMDCASGIDAESAPDAALRELAESVGLLLEWTGSDDQPQTLSQARQRAMLAGLGWPADNATQVAQSLQQWRESAAPHALERLPPLLIADANEPFTVPVRDAAERQFTLRLETGERLDGRLDARGCLPAVDAVGYHRLSLDGGAAEVTLAVAPARCCLPADRTEDISTDLAKESSARALPWGVSAQLYSLHRDVHHSHAHHPDVHYPGSHRQECDAGIGDLADLDALCQGLAKAGADAVAISPIHALFTHDTQRISPYSPSSRLFYNVWHAAPECVFDRDTLKRILSPDQQPDQDQNALAAQESPALIDWPTSVRLKLARLEQLFAYVEQNADASSTRERFERYVTAGGEALRRHCRFEVLIAHADIADWRRWPDAWQNPASDEVEAFASEHQTAVRFAAFLQWLMATGLDHVQSRAESVGMAIGVIADLAVGVDPAGSQAWSFPEELLPAFSVGAPPDAFNAQGQSWGVAAFSPQGLLNSGYRGFLAMLRAGFAHAGGLRIDHILGLSRLWLVPEGESAQAGAYLRYPLDDLLRLVALESWRHHAIVIGEDLGTVETGLRQRLTDRGVLGMSVMWFERDGDDFLAGDAWRQATMATTTTHDLPSVAGWWLGNDLRWRASLGLLAENECLADLEAQRRLDRRRLLERCGLIERSESLEQSQWRKPRAADGLAAEDYPLDEVVNAALALVAATPTALALLPLEDLVGAVEQPNLPGTLDEHPNWRRRLPLSVAGLLDSANVHRRLERIATLRRRSDRA